MKKAKVFVATHKKVEIELSEMYCIIQGGAELYPEDRFGYQLDNEGINISSKKEYYNELTSFFWAWKNDESSIKGLCHYRRYFMAKDSTSDKEYMLNNREVEKKIRNVEALLPYPYLHKGHSNEECYVLGAGRQQDLDVLKDVVSEFFPEYRNSLDIVLRRNYACYCNMLIATREVFDSYAEWLFSVLEKVEERVDLTGYTPAEIRIFGYMGELLLNVWFHHNKVKIRFVPVAKIDYERKWSGLKKFIASVPIYEMLHRKEFYFKNYL